VAASRSVKSFDKLTLAGLILTSIIMLGGSITTIYSVLNKKMDKVDVYRMEAKIEKIVESRHQSVMTAIGQVRTEQELIRLILVDTKPGG